MKTNYQHPALLLAYELVVRRLRNQPEHAGNLLAAIRLRNAIRILNNQKPDPTP